MPTGRNHRRRCGAFSPRPRSCRRPIKVLRTRETAAISLAMYSMFTGGVTLWGIYGVMTMQWSIIIANGVTVVLALDILG